MIETGEFQRSAPPGTGVFFGGTPATNVNVTSSSQLTASAPRLPAGIVPVTVQTNSGLEFGTSVTTIGSYFTYLPDTLAHTIAAAANPAPNGSGWNKTNPVVTITGNDGPCGSGIRSITYSATGAQPIPSTTVNAASVPVTITTEGVTTISYTAIGNAGNASTNTGTFTVKLDKTAPTNVAVTTDRGADHNGWYNHPFIATWSGTDSLSGIASCTTTTYSGPDTVGANLTGTCTDIAGNTSAPVTLAFKYDATPPVNVQGVPARPPDSYGWYNHPVTIAFTGTDATSGIDTCTTTTYAGPDARGIVIGGSCTDRAGNTTAVSVTLNYDHTPPTAHIDGNPVQTVLGVPVTGTAADNLSGVASIKVSFADLFGLLGTTVRQATCTAGCGTTAATWTVSTGGLLGIYTVTAAATDVAGNTGPASNQILLAIL